MNGTETDDGKSVALYWDFENLHASLCEEHLGEGAYAKPDARFKSQEPLVDVQAVIELAASFGPIAINRAYCNWQFFGRYRDALLQAAVELIQLFPPGGSAKNGADIKLCLDATEDIARFAHIGTVVIVGGDSDFMPVAQKIKAATSAVPSCFRRKSRSSAASGSWSSSRTASRSSARRSATTGTRLSRRDFARRPSCRRWTWTCTTRECSSGGAAPPRNWSTAKRCKWRRWRRTSAACRSSTTAASSQDINTLLAAFFDRTRVGATPLGGAIEPVNETADGVEPADAADRTR